jgi:regulator of RNase E activity RraA
VESRFARKVTPLETSIPYQNQSFRSFSGGVIVERNFTPRDIVARWTWHSLEQPIVIGEVKVSSGDLIVCDRDGVIVVPSAIADEIVAKAATIVGTESDMRKAIIAGMDPKQTYLLHGKF